MLYAHCLFNLPFFTVYVVINEQNTDQQNLTPLHPYIPVLRNRGSSQERDHHGSLRKFVLTLLSVKAFVW